MTQSNSRWMNGLLLTSMAVLCIGLISTFSPVQSQQTKQVAAEIEPLQAMSQRDFNGLLAGRGMGLARIADISGYPGPMHVLEMAEELEITEQQREQTQDIMQRMRATAQRRGRELIEAERRLEALFDGGPVQPSAVDAALLEIARLQAQVRASHLHAHIEQARVMSSEQIEQYTELRTSAQNRMQSQRRDRMRERMQNRQQR